MKRVLGGKTCGFSTQFQPKTLLLLLNTVEIREEQKKNAIMVKGKQGRKKHDVAIKKKRLKRVSSTSRLLETRLTDM